METRSKERTTYIGNFIEHKYDFFESISHGDAGLNTYTIPFDLKFGGIRPYPYDSTGKQEYTWLRNPHNLLVTFTTAKSIGLSNFVTHEQYNARTNDWCCNTQWENKSLNEIIKGFVESDTLSSAGDYYSKFWQRRKKEGNLKVTYQILKEIHEYYNYDQKKPASSPIDTVMRGLLHHDLQLAKSDSNEYKNKVLDYFSYLRSVRLEYSAYKLIFHNSSIQFPKVSRDSLLSTLTHDTLTFEQWNRMDDNAEGWMNARGYQDPERYYGP